MNNLDLAKKELKIIEMVQGKTSKCGKYTYVNPCPICGKYDHFYIVESTNTFYSENGCCRGGSVVDWFVQKDNISISEAIKTVLSMAGYERNMINSKEIALFKEKKDKEKRLEAQKEMILDNFKNGKINLVSAIIKVMNVIELTSSSKYESSKKERIISKCYHKLTQMYKALIRIENKSMFLTWLMYFIDYYTNLYIQAKDQESLLQLCYNFKSEFSKQYDIFLQFEKMVYSDMSLFEGDLKYLYGG